jgi:hypothetical protein
MKSKILILLLFLIGNLSVFAQKRDNKLKIEQALQTNHKKIEAFYKNELTDSLIEMYTPKCYFIRDFSERIDNQSDIKKKLNSDFKNGFRVISLIFTPDDYRIYGDIVVDVGVITMKFVEPNIKDTITEDYNYTTIWKSSRGYQYRIRSEMWGYVTNPCK